MERSNNKDLGSGGAPKLVAATSGSCCGLEKIEDENGKRYEQIENDGSVARHTVPVQHFEDGSMRAACGFLDKDTSSCKLVYKEVKDEEADEPGYERLKFKIRVKAVCPWNTPDIRD